MSVTPPEASPVSDIANDLPDDTAASGLIARTCHRTPLSRLIALLTLTSAGLAQAAAPTPPGIPSATVDSGSVMLTWRASQDDEGVTGYNVYRNDRYMTTVSGTRHVMELEGRASDFYVTAFDSPTDGSARGYSNRSKIVRVFADGKPSMPLDDEPATAPEKSDNATPDTPDTNLSGQSDSGPSMVSGLATVSATPDAVAIQWAAAASAVGYNIYRDDAYLSTVNGVTLFEDTSVPVGATAVEYQVVAFDGTPLFSPYSDALVVTLADGKAGGGTDDGTTDGSSDGSTDGATDGSTGGQTGGGTDGETDVGNGGDTGTGTGGGPDLPLPMGDLPAPVNLNTRLVSNDWVELQWDPVDAAVAYNVYRDGELLYTVDSTKEGYQDQRYWKTTSYVDCDYTRFLVCIQQRPEPGSAHSYAVTAIDAAGGEGSASGVLDVQLLSNERLDVQNTLADFQVVFEDEFDGDSIDYERWNTRLPWGPDVTINRELQYFVDLKREPDFGYDPFTLTGNTLQITGDETPPALLAEANDLPFVSGAITSRDSFNFTYGFVEARMKVAKGQGKLSSFFLFHQYAVLNAAEIDITEYLGERPEDISQNYHWRDERDNATQHASPTMFEKRPGTLFHEDYHTYGVLWEPNLVVWTIDGEEILRMSGPEVSRQRSFIILYLVMGSGWTEAPNPADADFDVPLEIDWIKVWQRPLFIAED